MRRLLIAAAIGILTTPPLWAQDLDDQLARCRSIGLEGFIQNLVGQDVGVTTTILAFCDDYRKLFEMATMSAQQLEQTTARVAELGQTAEVLSAQVDALQAETRILRNRLPPEDAILIVDDADGCPIGWVDMAVREPKIFAGRTIVARGFETEREPRQYRDTGGTETHRLALAEMPRHSHTVTSSPPADGRAVHDGFGGSAAAYGLSSTYDTSINPITGWSRTQHSTFMSSEGNDQPHNNMPPYVALYFCKQG